MTVPFSEQTQVNTGTFVVWRIVGTSDGLKHWLWTCVRSTRPTYETAETVYCGRTEFDRAYRESPMTCLECHRR